MNPWNRFSPRTDLMKILITLMKVDFEAIKNLGTVNKMDHTGLVTWKNCVDLRSPCLWFKPLTKLRPPSKPRSYHWKASFLHLLPATSLKGVDYNQNPDWAQQILYIRMADQWKTNNRGLEFYLCLLALSPWKLHFYKTLKLKHPDVQWKTCHFISPLLTISLGEDVASRFP